MFYFGAMFRCVHWKTYGNLLEGPKLEEANFICVRIDQLSGISGMEYE